MNRFFTSMGGLDPPNQKPRNENLKVWFGASSAPMEKRVFGSLKRDQSLGAAGGIEAVFAIMSLVKGVMPPTLNLTAPDPAAEGLKLVGPMAEPKSLRHVLSNGFGFGGVNASLVFSQT
jgi:hypothetical protein